MDSLITGSTDGANILDLAFQDLLGDDMQYQHPEPIAIDDRQHRLLERETEIATQ